MFQSIIDLFTKPIVDGVIKEVRSVINEETASLREQISQISEIRADVAVIREDVADVRKRLEAIHPTGEIPVTVAADQGN